MSQSLKIFISCMQGVLPYVRMFLRSVFEKIYAETSVQLGSDSIVFLSDWWVEGVSMTFLIHMDIKLWNWIRNSYKFVSVARGLKTKVSGKQSRCHTPYSRFHSELLPTYSIEYLRCLWHADRGRPLLQALSPVPFWRFICPTCWDDPLSKLVIYPDCVLRKSLALLSILPYTKGKFLHLGLMFHTYMLLIYWIRLHVKKGIFIFLHKGPMLFCRPVQRLTPVVCSV